jgi:hypothetical protein
MPTEKTTTSAIKKEALSVQHFAMATEELSFHLIRLQYRYSHYSTSIEILTSWDSCSSHELALLGNFKEDYIASAIPQSVQTPSCVSQVGWRTEEDPPTNDRLRVRMTRTACGAKGRLASRVTKRRLEELTGHPRVFRCAIFGPSVWGASVAGLRALGSGNLFSQIN